MKGLENQSYIILLFIANIIAILQLVAATKWTRIARLSFFLLFTWASVTNWWTSVNKPQAYLNYADLTWSDTYANFINGWFSDHIAVTVGCIAICQLLIGISMLLRGAIYKIGCTGAIIFLVAIIPFGVGSGFPSTAVMAIAVYFLLKKDSHHFIWEKRRGI
jgi:hypothetical protein